MLKVQIRTSAVSSKSTLFLWSNKEPSKYFCTEAGGQQCCGRRHVTPDLVFLRSSFYIHKSKPPRVPAHQLQHCRLCVQGCCVSTIADASTSGAAHVNNWNDVLWSNRKGKSQLSRDSVGSVTRLSPSAAAPSCYDVQAATNEPGEMRGSNQTGGHAR